MRTLRIVLIGCLCLAGLSAGEASMEARRGGALDGPRATRSGAPPRLPEPTAMLLIGTGLIGLARWGKQTTEDTSTQDP